MIPSSVLICAICWYFIKSFNTVTQNCKDQGLPITSQKNYASFSPFQDSLSRLSQINITFLLLALHEFFLNELSFLSRDLTSMGRLSDVPNKNPAIIWWTSKDVVIYRAHWKAIHGIFMGKHVQGLSAGKQTQHYHSSFFCYCFIKQNIYRFIYLVILNDKFSVIS